MTLTNPELSDHTEKSASLYDQACEVIPGGVTANIKYFKPHPLVMERGEKSHLFDVDGNEYIDYLLCYGALILGHGHHSVFEAVQNQMTQAGTTIFGTPHRLEIEMANKLIDLYPGIEMVRYTNSGLEATQLALRIASAYTGKSKVAKFEGHYHGGYDQVLLSVNPDESKAGLDAAPNAVPESSGISDHHVKNTLILPFNNINATEKLLREHAKDLSAVIIEPVQGGFIPAKQSFLNGLRKVTEELGILLIFDEVKTGFRLGLGGAQEIYNIKPDLTALGKVLGGGFPVGAVGGKKEIMMISASNKGRDILTAGANNNHKNEVLFHSGTYNGHPTVLAAGLATIHVLEQGSMMKDLISKTESLRSQLESLYASKNIPMKTVGIGSIFNILFTKSAIENYRDMKHADRNLREKIDYELLKLGIYTKPLNRYSMSVVHTDEDILATVHAHEKAIERVVENES
ncbi:aspartate aminotransferase family protein [Pseudalkalibacillus berkeleyi]|uniref:Aspartate aminotransferase family protein n=1 Tax=Pseudalkalibacillus berkeleyi TaxID=1069813 RepID=A0ABS9GVB5_9BACL|nr:aspartate aminotransferase family protein [Pseudalkalibacillus berkeleyi]MCF6136772.1 aspartate aminotransferase family protein [Pseudalkalibacillus berkeleyi]